MVRKGPADADRRHSDSNGPTRISDSDGRTRIERPRWVTRIERLGSADADRATRTGESDRATRKGPGRSGDSDTVTRITGTVTRMAAGGMTRICGSGAVTRIM